MEPPSRNMSTLIECDRDGDALVIDDEGYDPLRRKAIAAFSGTLNMGWKLAEVVAQIAELRRYQLYGFQSLKEWAQADFDGRLTSNVHHYRDIGSWLLSLPGPEQKEWRKHHVWSVIAARKMLDKPESRAQVLEHLAAGATTKDLRRIAQQDPDQHETTEWRTFTLRVSVETHGLLLQARDRVAILVGKREPSDDEVAVAMSMALLNEPVEGEGK